MSISLISSQNTSAYQSTDATKTNPMDKEFKALGQALQSGDLKAAQQAFATIQANAPTPPANSSSSTTSSSSTSTSGPGADFQALAKALSSGDLKSAQSAFAALQKDRPHGPPPGGPPPSGTDTTSTSSASSTDSTSTSALLNLLA